MDDVKLLPCPFCGEESRLHVEHLEGTIIHPAYRVRCDNCGAAIGYTDNDHVGTWNTRANMALLAAEVAEWKRVAAAQAELHDQSEAHVKQLAAKVEQYKAARVAYTSEFPLNADGEPDVGNIHANIRQLKAKAERLEVALWDLLSWIPEKPSEPEWRFKAGEQGADDAIAEARAALGDTE